MSKIFIANALPHMFGEIKKTANASKDKSNEEKEEAVKAAVVDEIILSCKMCGKKDSVDSEKRLCSSCIVKDLIKKDD